MDADRKQTGPSAVGTGKKRSCLGFFFKSTLGCFAFAIGSLIVLVLLLPRLVGAAVPGIIEQGFAEQFHGTVSVADVDLAWSSEQSATDVVVFDPDGHEVARATVRLPSILDLLGSEGKELGHVAIDVDATLVADDAGVTNLERALAPRHAASTEETETTGRTETRLEAVSQIDLVVALRSRSITWSDAETRARGAPYEVRGLEADLVLRPGEPISLRARAGLISGDESGELALDATVHGPIDPEAAWPVGAIDAKARVKGLSVPLIDGIAAQGGHLVEVLGSRLDLDLDVAGMTPDSGDVTVKLASDAAKVEFTGRFEGGVLRSAGETSLTVSVGAPRGFVADALKDVLPPDAEIVWGDSNGATTLEGRGLVVPVVWPTDDPRALAATLARVRGEIDVVLADGVYYTDARTRESGAILGATGMQLTVRLPENAPVSATLFVAIDTGQSGDFTVDIAAERPWEALVPGGTLPPVDAELSLRGVSSAAVGAMTGLGDCLVGLTGDSLGARVKLEDASLDSGTAMILLQSAQGVAMRLVASLRGGRLVAEESQGLILQVEPPAGWFESCVAPRLADVLGPERRIAFLPGDQPLRVTAAPLSLPLPDIAAGEVPGAADMLREGSAVIAADLGSWRYADPMTEDAGVRLGLDRIRIDARLEPSKPLSVDVASGLETGESGKVAVHARIDEPWKLAEGGDLPPIDGEVSVDGIATAAIDAFAAASSDTTATSEAAAPSAAAPGRGARPGRIAAALGPRLDVDVAVEDLTMDSGRVRLGLDADQANVRFEGALADGVLATGEGGSAAVTFTPAPGWLERELAPHLPEGTRVALASAAKPIELRVEGLSVPIEAAEPMKALACAATLALGTVEYEDPTTRAAGLSFALDDVVATARLAPASPLALGLRGGIGARRGGKPEGARGELSADVALADPWGDAPVLNAEVSLDGLPTGVLDALAKGEGKIAAALGDRLRLDVRAQELGLSGSGGFALAASSPSLTLDLRGKVDQGVVSMSGDDRLDLAWKAPEGFLDAFAGPSLPAGASLSIPPGEAIALRVRDVRIELPQGDAPKGGAALLAKAALSLELTAPAMTYREPATTVEIRGLRAEATLGPTAPPSARVTAQVVAEPPGNLSASVRALDPLALLGEEGGSERFRAAIDVQATGLPTAIVDALAAQEGLLVDVLGPRLDAKVQSQGISASAGDVHAELRSTLGTVRADCAVRDGMVVPAGGGSIDAHVGLTPLSSKRLVGNLMPLLVNIRKPEGAAPMALSVRDFSLPLDGDLTKLDANVRLDLGEVTYQLLPGLDSTFLGALTETRAKRIPAIAIPIQDGVARYESLPIEVGSQKITFRGSYGLADEALDFKTDVPLAILGKGLDKKLDSARKLLDADLIVPIEVRGTLSRPKVRLGEGFVEKVLEGASKGLFERLLKGDD